MQAFLHLAELDTLLDVLAIGASLVMIFLLLCNRIKYGRMVLTGKDRIEREGFAGQVSLQMMTQQTRKAYDSLQRSLAQEFDTLRSLGESIVCAPEPADPCHGAQPAAHRGSERRRRYRRAEEMMVRGEDAQRIARHCGLLEGELELLQDLHQLAQGATRALHAKGST
jgi:hypothetical protein